MIQANPSGVIQTAAGTQQQQQQALAAATAMHKGVGVVYVAKPANSTVIHTTSGNAVQVRNKVRSSARASGLELPKLIY